MTKDNMNLVREIEKWLKYESNDSMFKRLQTMRRLLASGYRIRVGDYIGTPRGVLLTVTSNWVETRMAQLAAEKLRS